MYQAYLCKNQIALLELKGNHIILETLSSAKEMGFKYLLKHVVYSCSLRSEENFFSMGKEK